MSLLGIVFRCGATNVSIHSEFISRDMWIEKARERAKMYTWGERQEQKELRELRNRSVPNGTGVEVI